MLNKLPEVKFSRNGYEIRADVLKMATDLVQAEYSLRFQGWEMSALRDEKTGQIVSKVGMPELPGVQEVLKTAEQLYKFVTAAEQKN